MNDEDKKSSNLSANAGNDLDVGGDVVGGNKVITNNFSTASTKLNHSLIHTIWLFIVLLFLAALVAIVATYIPVVTQAVTEPPMPTFTLASFANPSVPTRKMAVPTMASTEFGIASQPTIAPSNTNPPSASNAVVTHLPTILEPAVASQTPTSPAPSPTILVAQNAPSSLPSTATAAPSPSQQTETLVSCEQYRIKQASNNLFPDDPDLEEYVRSSSDFWGLLAGPDSAVHIDSATKCSGDFSLVISGISGERIAFGTRYRPQLQPGDYAVSFFYTASDPISATVKIDKRGQPLLYQDDFYASERLGSSSSWSRMCLAINLAAINANGTGGFYLYFLVDTPNSTLRVDSFWLEQGRQCQ